MAKVKRNKFTVGISGKIGDLVFRQRKDGTTVVAAAPDFSDRVLSEEQVAHNNRFKQASAYASEAAKTNPMYAELAAGTSKNAYNVALSDWFHAPVIHEVKRQAKRIRVNATDNVFVAKVLITLSDPQGQILEQGEAVCTRSPWWEYKTSAPTEAKISVEAFDLAGNLTRQEA
jgi:hypothetical protein